MRPPGCSVTATTDRLGSRVEASYIDRMLPLTLSVGDRSRAAARLARLPHHALLALLLIVPAGSCDDPAGVEVRQVQVAPEVALILLGDNETFTVRALGPAGTGATTAGVEWFSSNPAVAAVDNEGQVRGVASGEALVVARLAGTADTALVEVYEPPAHASFEPGVSYLGRRNYIEYIPGELPVVLSAPHGGGLAPPEIPNRQGGTQVTDKNTLDLTLKVRDALIELTGFGPHVVLAHLERAKMDPNREIQEAAEGNPFAERAWTEYHDFIRSARVTITTNGEGMFFDMHGHGHPIPRIELGYLLTRDDLNQPDASINSLSYVLRSSIREIGRDSPIPFAEVVRGAVSFGGMLEAEGIPAIPSPENPMPGQDPYFTGGYSTREHGSLSDTELVSGIQLEHHFVGVRDSDANRRAYAAVLARVIRDYMLEHMGFFEPN